MPRRTTLFTPGACYHIYNRGANKVTLFPRHHDYLAVIKLLKHYICHLQIAVIAYCLLPNHYHWLVCQDGQARAGLLPQRVFNIYSHALHRAQRHTGTLFEGPYKIIKIDQPAYLLHLCRYIHANPLRHGIATDLTLWPYSNYPEWIGLRQGTLYDPTFIQTHFATPAAYQTYLQSYLTTHYPNPPALTDYLTHLDP